jgi:hypothetical protein
VRRVPGEPEFLTSGIYNLGFIAVRNDHAGRAFADWWAEATLRAGTEQGADLVSATVQAGAEATGRVTDTVRGATETAVRAGMAIMARNCTRERGIQSRILSQVWSELWPT